MTIPGLFPLDVPTHEREPRPCKRCTHAFFDASDTALRYLRCGRSVYGQQCRYERHITGDCGPDAKHFLEKGGRRE